MKFPNIHTLNFTDDDEFDTYDSASGPPICEATAIYDYVGQQSDELTIKPGEGFSSINIHEFVHPLLDMQFFRMKLHSSSCYA